MKELRQAIPVAAGVTVGTQLVPRLIVPESYADRPIPLWAALILCFAVSLLTAWGILRLGRRKSGD